MEGGYNPATTAAATAGNQGTELQQSIFGAPPSAAATAASTAATSGSGAGLKPPDSGMAVEGQDGARSPQGVKRGREDESDDEDAPMDEDDDGDEEWDCVHENGDGVEEKGWD